ncbi:MAG: hypothetical protein SNH94_04700 [Rikenellaceae bacterium]
MRKFKNIFIAAIAVVVAMIPSVLMAQSYGSINTYSPYSMYGLGELNTQGTLNTRSLAGVGVSMRSPTEINLLNPAAYSGALSRSVLFSYGMEGSNYFNSQSLNGSTVKNSYAAFNIHDIAIQIPITKKMGMAISVTPYSSIGYNIATTENVTDIGLLSYTYEGGGDLTQVKLGVGWEIAKNLSVGVAAQYYWGGLYRSFTMSPYVVTGYGTYYTTVGETSYDISSIKGQLGLQWVAIATTKRNLNFGLTYDLGGDLNPDMIHKVYTDGSLLTIIADYDAETLDLVLPGQLSAGVSYQTPKWLLGFDYTYQDWLSKNSDFVETTSSGVDVAYNDFSTYKLGAQWTPNRNDVRKYFKRVSYRAGLRYGGYQQTFSGEELTQYAVTLGASFPIKMSGISKVDVGLEYGARGSDNVFISGESKVGLIRQDYFKFAFGFTLFGEDYWFQRPKFD